MPAFTSTGCISSTSGSRTVLLRTLLIGCLLAATGICVSLSFLKLQETEERVGLQNYYSVRDSTLLGAREITARKLRGVELWSTLMANILPNASDWPFIRMDGYIPVAQKLAALTSSTTYALMVLLSPSQAPAFEEHVKVQYEVQKRPTEAGYSDFGFGIWKRSEESPYEDGRLRDVTGVTGWDSPRSGELMAALTMHNQPAASSLLLNLYSIEDRGVHIDSMMECVKNHTEFGTPGTPPECSVTTDMLELVVRPGPAGLVFHPIFPANDEMNFVGFATTSLHWEEVLTDVVPDYVTGLTCVISTATQAWTYEIRDGVPVSIGEGDQHDGSYDEYSKSIILNESNSGAKSSATYTLTVYPSDEMLNAFTTKVPLAVALGFFGAILACAIVFFVYDWLMRHENHQRIVVLEMKRRFVRFISHEIRTPLNTVCMGLELLQGELHSMALSENQRGTLRKEKEIDFWTTIVDDIHENAYVAVAILNDLLNYDKLETGTMKMEVTPVAIWELIERTHNQFRIQATNAKLDLQLDLQLPSEADQDLESSKDAASCRFCMVGDDVRLGQVLRNFISNALKFTLVGGTIKMIAKHIPNGLPNAKRMIREDGVEISRERAGSIVITISDNGVGMTTDQLQRLFSEGVQFDANRLQHGGGSGLGLSIAKGIVEQHHGTIAVSSDGPGHGTAFTIEFPLYKQTQLEIDDNLKSIPENSILTDKTSKTESQSTGSSEERCRRVLVAEDAISSRKMLVRLLERAGHEAVPTVNGQNAVEEIRMDQAALQANPNHIPIDTILMDYEMPVLKGPDASQQIRDMGFTGIILGVTGNVLEEDVDYFKKHGADDVLSKPVRMECINAFWHAKESKSQWSNKICCSSS